jgi:hypothetical protein
MACWNCIPPEWRRARQLTREERGVFLRALLLLPLTALVLRWAGLRHCQRLLGCGGKQPRHVENVPPQQAQSTARLVAAAGRWGLWRGNCLERSLVLCSLLARWGIPAELRIGVRFEAGKLMAHAWVTSHGTVLTDSGEDVQPFAAFERAVVPHQEVP